MSGGGPTTRPFRFGLGPAGLGGLASADAWRDTAREAEDLGYSTLCFGEHLDDRPAPGHLALAVALWTTSLRTAVHVFCNDFRHPAILAKEAATLAMLTGGRVEVGLGAGWMRADYDRLGVPFDRPGARIERLGEAVELIRAGFDTGAARSDGPAYRVDGLPVAATLGAVSPPPIVMGGGGPKMLALAARHADVISVNVRLDRGVLDDRRGRSGTRDATEEKVRIIREAAGERFDDLELQVEIHHVEITEDRAGALRRAAGELGVSEAEAATSPHVLVGPPTAVAERLEQRREDHGLSYVCMRADARRAFAPVVALLAGR